MDHILRYHDDPNVKMVVVLGEVSTYIVYAIVYREERCLLYHTVQPL